MTTFSLQKIEFTAAEALRQKAEAVARSTRELVPLTSLTPHEIQQTLHELQVRQIELEIQNEELRRIQSELDESRENYFDFYDRAPVGYCTVSQAGMILQINLTAASLLGFGRFELSQQPIGNFIYKEDQDHFYLFRRLLLTSGTPQAGELRLKRADGTHFWVQLDATVAQDARGEPLLRLIFSDISVRKQLDQALQEKLQELESARQAADKANLAKSQFLSSMSHELRSPLNAILGFAQLMAAASTTPSQTVRINHILEAGWYLLALINEILDLSLIESGKLVLSLSPVPLAEVLSESQSLVELPAAQKNVSLHVTTCAPPCIVSADQIRLKQVMVNLLSNAIKYNQTGGYVQVFCTRLENERIRISVQDSGEGLSPDKLSQLFQPFNRLGKEGSTIEGTGIGLVVSKRLVEAMGGQIGVHSVVGSGSVFWVEFNLVTPPDSENTLWTLPDIEI